MRCGRNTLQSRSRPAFRGGRFSGGSGTDGRDDALLPRRSAEKSDVARFAQYLRGETGITAHAHIRKYDGEPLTPRHIVHGVLDIITQGTAIHVPTQEIMV